MYQGDAYDAVFGVDAKVAYQPRRVKIAAFTPDLVILDPEKIPEISDEISEAPIEEFDNYMRLVTRHPGVVAGVMVGGQLIYQQGDFVEEYGKSKRFGRFLPYQGLDN